MSTELISKQSPINRKHLLIIGVLVLSFSVSFLVRSQAADFGYELNEFDPFFNFRATQFIVENGISNYFDWNDDLSWYPNGRDVSATSQVMLHITTAVSYWIFGGNGNLYEFTILFPVVVGSLSAIVIFALVRTIGGTTAALFSALFFAISPAIIVRGSLGWFKSEPLGIFYGLIGLYLFLSGINSKNRRISVIKLIGAGIILTFSLSAWGGSQFFLLPLGIFFLTLPFFRKDHNFLLWSIPLFSSSLLLTSLGFERLGFDFVTGLGGFALIGPTLFLVACIFIQNKSKEETKTKNGLLFLCAIILSGIILIAINAELEFINLPSFRYLNAINPFLTTTDPLVDSVAEHATTSLRQSFFFHSVLMIFAGIGIWLLLKKQNRFFIKNDMISFTIILGLLGVYISSAFVRLEVFASISVIVLSSLGLSILVRNILEHNYNTNFKIKLVFLGGIIILLVIPLAIPGNANPITSVKGPPTILNGGTQFGVATNDWTDTMEWIKNNTPKDAVIASWWDYGYWIQTLGERATLADNSTLSTAIIKNIAEIFLSPPDEAWKKLIETKADYIVVFVSGEKLNVQNPDPLYLLDGGGDESKKQWFMRIAGEPLPKYLHSDGMSGTDYFWENTLLGKMFPFEPLLYADFQNNVQSEDFKPGRVPIYVKENKFPKSEDGPLKLVYSSPSYDKEKPGIIIGVFVYEINKDYVPSS